MHSPVRPHATHPFRALVAVAFAAGSLVLAATPAQAASCNGNSHDISLTNGAASPGVASTVTPVTFSVRYVSNAGCAPSSIVVRINGVGAMSLATGGTPSADALKSGVVYQATRTLPAGTRTYAFDAVGGSGVGEKAFTLSTVSPRQVAVSAPPPPPTPKPTPVPTPPPTPAPAPPAPAPVAPGPVTGPAPPAAPAQPVFPVETPEPDEPGDDTDAETSESEASPTPRPRRTPRPTATPAADPSNAPLAAGIWRDPPLDADVVGALRPASAPFEVSPSIIAWLVATVVGLGLLVVLSPRPERSDPELATAGVGVGFAGGGGTGLGVSAASAAPPEREVSTRTEERNIPRWLRPSVQEGRRGIVRERPPEDDTLAF